ncbi:hypothetical protein EV13_2835 [Prochlorococcus sp. MIT 0702]|nr:hypothetical protein EV12_2784 [Prochlorococcus sp. MIT 0701]KGG26058.1 hypothetical protein EV13_2835 [Prochlorococcus sp. MIT 0702]
MPSATSVAELAAGAVVIVSTYFFLPVLQRHCAASDLTGLFPINFSISHFSNVCQGFTSLMLVGCTNFKSRSINEICFVEN